MSATPISIAHIPPGSPWWFLPLIVAVLALHVGAGSIGIVTGYGAISVRKGENLHRAFGKVFSFAMMMMAVAATGLALWIHQVGNVIGGIFAFYLVATAWRTVRAPEGRIGRFEIAAFLAILAAATTLLSIGVIASLSPKGGFEGYSAILYYVLGSLTAFAAALDFRVIRSRGISGVQRVARHLWRMCFAFFFATGSFFLGQQKVMPVFMHGSAVLWVLGLAPLGFMLFWLVRVRVSSVSRRRALAA
jgi:uncharacterized membrane protein